ncbi:hypothetical protein HHI36_022077 [Cryptolaemus montrouzieri]|uniref:DZANK-type domain-containing protein n=1 Tax=Cryptolaemus montrouzieri TaxID=559131 RepID=A0ABD2MZL3_9CUCU
MYQPPQYYVVKSPNYPQQYQILPQTIPFMNQDSIVPQPPQFFQNPKIVLSDPIVLDSSSIQHIPMPAKKREGIPSYGLNTMTVIPKILIDKVSKEPAILEEIKTQTPTDDLTVKTESNQKLGEQVNSLETTENPTIGNSSTENFPVAQSNQSQNEDLSKDPQVPPENYQVFDVASPLVEETKTNTQPKQEEIPIEKVEGQGNKDQVIIEEQIVLSDSDCKPIENDAIESKPNEASAIHNLDHPRVLHPVQLSSDIENVEIVGAGSVNISLETNSPQKIQTCANSQDLELVNLLQKSLVPFINLKTNEEPKLLVSYPVINTVGDNVPEHPSAIVVQTLNPEPTFCAQCSCSGKNRKKDLDVDDLQLMKNLPVLPKIVQDISDDLPNSNYEIIPPVPQSLPTVEGDSTSVVSGYQVSSASGYYEDPYRKIIYNKPTQINIVPPQVTNIPSTLFPTLPSIQYPFAPESPTSNIIFRQPSFPSLISPRRSKLIELLRYLLDDIPSASQTSPNPYICPYCSNVHRSSPSIIRCPHCLRNQAVLNGQNPQGFCPFCSAHAQNIGSSLTPNLVPSRCPYCAKYRGELNQIEKIDS